MEKISMKTHKVKENTRNELMADWNKHTDFCFCWKTHFTFYYFLFFEDWKNYLSSNDDDDFFCSTKDPGTPFYIPSKKSDHQKNRKLFSRFHLSLWNKTWSTSPKKRVHHYDLDKQTNKTEKKESNLDLSISLYFFSFEFIDCPVSYTVFHNDFQKKKKLKKTTELNRVQIVVVV